MSALVDPAILAKARGGDGGRELAPPSRHPPSDETLLVLSDVHLGSDLNDRAQPGDAPRRSVRIDDDLVALLRHYSRMKPPSGARWRLVIAGDFIDFIGMSIVARASELGAPFATELSEEEREHGLGNAADHARIKMRRVAERHLPVFASLADFVARGNTVTLVHGNHDIEFHWEGVREELKSVLLGHASEAAAASGAPLDARAFLSRITFNPWFLYVGGLAYIEHGHQYDAFCATDFVMAPLSPFDPRRIARGFSDVLLRFVVRSTRGLKEHGHAHKGLYDYVSFAVGLGARGLVKLAFDFMRAVVELFRLRRAHFAEAARAMKNEHEGRMALLAEASRISVERLRALAALQVPPVTRSIRGILGSVLLDRLAVGMVAAALLASVALFGATRGHFAYAAVGVLLSWALAHRYLAGQRKIDPDEFMIDRAGQLARLFPAAFVVMGHTHVPLRVPVNAGGATYVNVGSWAEEEEEVGDLQPYRAARTHLVIRPGDSAGPPVAEFLAWSPAGPTSFVSVVAPGAAHPPLEVAAPALLAPVSAPSAEASRAEG